MGVENAPLVEIASAACVECGQAIEAAEFSNNEDSAWPVIVAGETIGEPRQHRLCGGRVELGEVRPAWHFCDENCECGMGGLPERAG